MLDLNNAPIVHTTNRMNRAGAKLVLVEVENYDGEEGFMICTQASFHGNPRRKAVQFNADLNAALISLQTGDFLGFTF